MVTIEVQGSGDYEMTYTHSVWFNPSIRKFDTSLLHEAEDDNSPEKLIKSLKAHGFRELKTKKVSFGDNL